MKILKKSRLSIMILMFIMLFLATPVYAATPKEGFNYTNYNSTAQRPVNSKLGTASKVENGVAKTVEKEISNNIMWSWDKRRKDYDDLVYVIYKFPNKVNMTIEKHMDSYRYLNTNVSFTYAISNTSGTVLNYSNSASSELSTKYGTSTELEVDGLDFAKAKTTAYAEVGMKISTTVSTSKTYTYTKNITETYIIESTKPTYYMLESRGIFDVYVVQVYQVNYYQKDKKHHGLPWIAGYDTWDWGITNYTLKEQTVSYVYNDNTSETGFYEYSYINYKYEYTDNKVSNLVYY